MDSAFEHFYVWEDNSQNRSKPWKFNLVCSDLFRGFENPVRVNGLE